MGNVLTKKPAYKFAITLPAILFAAMLLIVPSRTHAASKKQGDVGLSVIQVVSEGTGLEITCEIKNRTESDIWLNVGNNMPGGLPYEVKVSSSEKKLLLGFRSAAPVEGTGTEDAVSSRYKKLGAGKTIMFKVTLDADVSDYDPLKGKGKGHIKASDIGVLEIVAGYYMRALDEEPDCCVPANRRGELFVRPDWASSSKEKTVSIEVSRKKRWK